MLKIRLRRIGKKHEPIFALVVAECKRAVKGDFIEKMGIYKMKTGELVVDKERVNFWLGRGAKLSDTVNNILVKEKVIKGRIIKKTVVPKKKEEGENDKNKNENKGETKIEQTEELKLKEKVEDSETKEGISAEEKKKAE